MTRLGLYTAASIAALGMSAAAVDASVALSDGMSDYILTFDTQGGSIASIDSGADSDFSLTVAAGQVATVTYSITDCCIVGDTFDALLDGAVLAWDSVGVTGSGYFEGTVTTILTAGTYIFDAIIDASGSRFALPADAFASFDITTTPIPLPAGGVLLLGGLGMLGAMRRRKKA